MTSLVRSRWAAIGAAIAVTLGAGGLISVNAASDTSSLVPIAPARILDTRSGDRIGSLDTAGSSDPYRLKVTGTASIPATGVTGVSLNVTAVDTQANDFGGFVSVYPCASVSTTKPDVSNMNFGNGQTLANAVTVPVSAGGYICLYVYGTAHLLVDANGYYTQTSTGSSGLEDRLTAVESNVEITDRLQGIDAKWKVQDDNGKDVTLAQVSRDGNKWVGVLENDLRPSFGTVAVVEDGKYYPAWGSGWASIGYDSYTYFENADCTGVEYWKFSANWYHLDPGQTLQDFMTDLSANGAKAYGWLFSSDLRTQVMVEVVTKPQTTTWHISPLATGGVQSVGARYTHSDGTCTAGAYLEAVEDYTYYPFIKLDMPNVKLPLKLVSVS